MYSHHDRPSVGGWIAILTLTLFAGSFLAGFMYHAGSLEGFLISYAIAFAGSFAAWRVATTLWAP